MITIIKGHFICTEKPSEFSVYPNHYLIAEDGIIEGLYDVLPEKYAGVPVHDYGDRMIMPGLCRPSCTRTSVLLPWSWHGHGTSGMA